MAVVHDMAPNPRQLRPLQHPSFLVFHLPRSKVLPGAVFLLLFNWVIRLVLGAWLSLHSSQLFQLHLLDRA